MLCIEKLTKRFGDNVAVGEATLDVDKPCMIGTTGRSSPGKFTLLRMINRVTDSSDGRIQFECRDVTQVKGREKRARQADCAMIFKSSTWCRVWTWCRTCCTAH